MGREGGPSPEEMGVPTGDASSQAEAGGEGKESREQELVKQLVEIKTKLDAEYDRDRELGGIEAPVASDTVRSMQKIEQADTVGEIQKLLEEGRSLLEELAQIRGTTAEALAKDEEVGNRYYYEDVRFSPEQGK